MKLPIYLDYQATTPVDADVLKAMLPYFSEVFGNASSRTHEFGWRAEAAVEKARAQVAALIGATPRELIFTSGATESDNLALTGLARANGKRRQIITTPVEHKAVIDTVRALETEGYRITWLPVDEYGRVTVEAVRAAITPDTLVVSVIAANNEIGTLNPLAEIGRVCRQAGVVFHTDATQWVGKLPFDVEALGVDLASVSAHKMYGPKGVGALYVRRKGPRVVLAPLLHGGGHERGLRSGTLNVPAIVGFGKAAELSGLLMEAEGRRLSALRERFWAGIRAGLDEVRLNGHPSERLPGNLNVSFGGVSGDALMIELRELAVSSGSACSSASLEPSYVLRNLGLGPEQVLGAVRFGIGRATTEEEIDFAVAKVVEAVKKLRALGQPEADPAEMAEVETQEVFRDSSHRQSP